MNLPDIRNVIMSIRLRNSVSRELCDSRGWILERPGPDMVYEDAMSCYPLFACHAKTKLHDDVGSLKMIRCH